MLEPITRLVASKQKHESRFYADGQECGRKWARERAEYVELRRLEEIRNEQRRRNEWDGYFDDTNSAWCAGEIFHHLIMGGDEIYGAPDRSESAEFWEFVGATEEQRTDLKFVLGFADGAAEHWDSVKDQFDK